MVLALLPPVCRVLVPAVLAAVVVAGCGGGGTATAGSAAGGSAAAGASAPGGTAAGGTAAAGSAAGGSGPSASGAASAAPADAPTSGSRGERMTVPGTVSAIKGECVYFTPGDMAVSWVLRGKAVAGIGAGDQITVTGVLDDVLDPSCGNAAPFVVTSLAR